MTREGWFADVGDADDPYGWQPCLQSDGYCVGIEMWFQSKSECESFIRGHILGRGMYDEDRP